MAEALVNARLGETWQAYSAGTHPAGFVNPLAIQALAEQGILHQGRSKHVDELRSISFDLVVTVCDAAAEECPLWLGSGQRIHEGFPDPAKVTGSDDEILQAFRQVMADIERRIPVVLNSISVQD